MVIETSGRASPIHVPAPEERVSVHNLVLFTFVQTYSFDQCPMQDPQYEQVLGCDQAIWCRIISEIDGVFEMFHSRSCEPCFAYYETKVFPINWKALLFGRVEAQAYAWSSSVGDWRLKDDVAILRPTRSRPMSKLSIGGNESADRHQERGSTLKWLLGKPIIIYSADEFPGGARRIYWDISSDLVEWYSLNIKEPGIPSDSRAETIPPLQDRSSVRNVKSIRPFQALRYLELRNATWRCSPW